MILKLTQLWSLLLATQAYNSQYLDWGSQLGATYVMLVRKEYLQLIKTAK